MSRLINSINRSLSDLAKGHIKSGICRNCGTEYFLYSETDKHVCNVYCEPCTCYHPAGECGN